jgi:hypothetical protein
VHSCAKRHIPFGDRPQSKSMIMPSLAKSNWIGVDVWET